MDLTGSKWQQKNGENAVFRRFMEICGSLWMMKWWPGRELNPRHADFQSAALPTELPGLSEERRIKQARGPCVNEPTLNQSVRAPKTGSLGLRHVVLGFLRPLAEEELLHFLDQESPGLGLD